MSEFLKRLRFGYPQGIGGHASTFDDQFDISDTLGIYRAFVNCDPLRGGVGWFTKRRPVIGRVARASTPINFTGDRIAKSITQRGVDIVVGGNQVVRDVLWNMYDDETNNRQYGFSIEKYDPAKYYTNGNWSGTFETCTEATAIGATSMNVYPSKVVAGVAGWGWSGLGEWVHSVRGHVSMAMGAIGGSVNLAIPMKGLWVNRDFAAPYRDGFFANPNVGADAGGVIKKTGFVIVPEKPWTSVYQSSLNIGYVIPAVDNFAGGTVVNDDRFREGGTRVFRASGACYPGKFKFWVLPEDEEGNEGTPLITGELELPMINDLTGIQNGGNAIRAELEALDATRNGLRPNIRRFNLYGKYTNVDPTNEAWTMNFGDSILPKLDFGELEDIDSYRIWGYGLDIPPQDVPPSYIGTFDLNCRQYDPSDSVDYDDQGDPLSDNAGRWTVSPRFNRFITSSGQDIFAEEYTDEGNDDELIIKKKQLSPWEFSVQMNNDVSSLMYIELEGYFGAWRITDYRFKRRNSTTGHEDWEIFIKTDNDLPVGWTSGNIRFCHPWLDDVGADNYLITYQIIDPEIWDQSRPMPFPEEATETYNIGYPYYTSHCENPLGTVRKCFNVWLNGERIENRLFSTTNTATGRFDTARFLLSEELPGKVTGCQYVTESQFIVTTESNAFIGEDYIVDGQVRFRILEGDLKYGSAVQLYASNRRVWGIDSKFGVWSITIDTNRRRLDISAIGNQQPIMNKGQQADFRSLVSGLSNEAWQRVSMVTEGEVTVIGFPSIDDTPGGGGKNNISMSTANTQKSFWYTIYDTPAGLMWSKDYGLGAGQAIVQTSTASAGAATNIKIVGHGYATGDELFVYSTLNSNGEFTITRVDADNFTIPLAFVSGETIGFVALRGTIPIFNLCNGVSNTVWGDVQTYNSHFTDADSDEHDNDDAVGNQPILMYLEPPEFRIDDIYPDVSQITQFYPRLIKYATNAIGMQVVVLPKVDNINQLAVHKTGLTTNAIQRGIKALGDAWRMQIIDRSTGTPRLSEIQLLFKSFGRRKR